MGGGVGGENYAREARNNFFSPPPQKKMRVRGQKATLTAL